jgi:formamidopyrimidine-DNA glycosylase
MPELPEVETVARDLRGLVVGATIVGAAGDWPRQIGSHTSLAAFADAVTGRRIEAVGRRAKLVVVELSGHAALTIHLKMTGQLFVVPSGTPADRHVHLALALDDGRELRFRDIRKFGRVGLWPRDPLTGAVLAGAAGGELFAGHGPEPLSASFTLRAFRARLKGRHGRLKPLLLDQAFVAGIGNIYADEALWRARMHGERPAQALTRPAVVRLLGHVRAVMTQALAQGGTSFDALYVNVNGESGYFERSLAVYGREGLPCRACGTPVRREAFMNRSSFSCPRCQPRPRPRRDARLR